MVTFLIDPEVENDIETFILQTFDKLRNKNNTSYMELKYINSIYTEFLTINGKIFLKLRDSFRYILEGKIHEFMDHEFMDHEGTEQYQRFIEMSHELLKIIKNMLL